LEDQDLSQENEINRKKVDVIEITVPPLPQNHTIEQNLNPLDVIFGGPFKVILREIIQVAKNYPKMVPN